MSDIPELNEDNISWIAYYDVTEHTNLSSIEPSKLHQESSNVDLLDSYDNGVKMEYEGPTRNYIIRSSTDGWVTAHMSTSNEYAPLESRVVN